MGKPKHVSRANRAIAQAGQWRALAGNLQVLLDENDPKDVPEELIDHFTKDVIKDAAGMLEAFDTGELEALTEEMQSWRDNFPDNLRETDKYQAVDDAVSGLEDISEDAPEIDSWDSIQEAIDDLENRADELESVEFPGMFG